MANTLTLKVGGEERTVSVENAELSAAEAMKLEDVFEGTFGMWAAAYKLASAKAYLSCALVLVQRQEPEATMDDLLALPYDRVLDFFLKKDAPAKDAAEHEEDEAAQPAEDPTPAA